MMVVVSYDVATEDREGQSRLRRIAKICQNFGQRVQYSVFECLVTPEQWARLKRQLLDTFNPQKDSLRFYFLGANYRRRIEHYGTKAIHDPMDTIII